MRGILKDLDSGPSRSRAAPVVHHLPTALARVPRRRDPGRGVKRVQATKGHSRT